MKKILAGLALLALAGCAAQPRQPAAPVSGPAPAPTVPIPPAPPKGEPALFIGIDAARLRTLAGAPAFTRKDGAAEMWRYDAGSCRIFFFLTGAPAKVQHIETLPRGRDGATDPQCLTALQDASKRS
jgi:hypothetical protein